ncbi:MAG TPA: hypothetical protein VG253_12575 [Streptosporangiaceae bacterium]|nr:hypothetical protein [Streptosporangiaceae bacterium]
MSGAELAARVTAAAAVLADYQREAAAADVAGRAMWGARLADTLGYLLAGLAQPASAGVLPDGSAWLTAADVGTVLGALHECAVAAGPDRQPRYAALARALGGDR